MGILGVSKKRVDKYMSEADDRADRRMDKARTKFERDKIKDELRRDKMAMQKEVSKAAIERNPVSIEMCDNKSIDEVYQLLCLMDNVSIYDGRRLAQPDEVVNYHRGDGFEKAILLCNIIRARQPNEPIEIEIDEQKVLVKAEKDYHFESDKGFKKMLNL